MTSTKQIAMMHVDSSHRAVAGWKPVVAIGGIIANARSVMSVGGSLSIITDLPLPAISVRSKRVFARRPRPASSSVREYRRVFTSAASAGHLRKLDRCRASVRIG
jgi:hypothetical protein